MCNENIFSLKFLLMEEKYNPEISVRISMNDYKKEEWLLNLPLYMTEEIGNIVKKEKNDLKMTDILTDKMTDKELQRLKILEVYFEKNNYIDNSEAQKILNVSDSTARRFLNKLVKNGILEAVGEKKGRNYRKK